MRIRCPHCQSPAKIRTSRPMSKLTVEHSLQCQNLDCAHTWVAHTSAVRTIAPSMCPDPTVYIQRSARSAKAATTSQLGLAIEDTQHPRAMAIQDG